MHHFRSGRCCGDQAHRRRKEGRDRSDGLILPRLCSRKPGLAPFLEQSGTVDSECFKHLRGEWERDVLAELPTHRNTEDDVSDGQFLPQRDQSHSSSEAGASTALTSLLTTLTTLGLFSINPFSSLRV